ncbi:MAG: lycopene cyclase domain-containing protein [Candidatus Iainarchaeum archaeon]|uniref:Lycopene cyclase domain-containing protein n=1 Tax=Candidatus Iainarchaeum sp. TaxID=3101447 RepID=A0A7T9DKD6_9ARCH|nr:MAG: lycopene cyclase domain-containing protein [Candidatus Diapherotrites archaeon]
MLAYTFAVVVGMMLLLFLDRALIRTHMLSWKNKRLWKTTGIFVVFQLIFDNYFTAQGLWVFDRAQVIGIFLPVIPIENLLFGVELLWMALLLYAFLSKESR